LFGVVNSYVRTCLWYVLWWEYFNSADGGCFGLADKIIRDTYFESVGSSQLSHQTFVGIFSISWW
jgi:hypothetical protein